MPLTTTLFDPLPRSERRFRWRTEPEYSYLNESGRPQATEVRARYTEWLSNYPATERAELVRSFRDRDDTKHTAAAFELVVHESLRRLGGEVRVVPRGTRTSHDFDMTIDGEAAAVEAAVVNGEPEGERRSRRRREAFLDALDKVPHPRYSIHIWDLELPREQPSHHTIRDRVHASLDRLTDDEAAHNAGCVSAWEYEALPRITLELGGFRLEFSAVPLPPLPSNPPEAITNRRGVIELLGGPPQLSSGVRDSVRTKYRKKTNKRYGVVDRPLVLALANTHWTGANQIEVMGALFGSQRLPVRVVDGRQVVGDPYWADDGLWGPHTRHPSSSVSAVIILPRFHAWDPGGEAWCAYINPWARTQAPNWIRRLPHYLADAEGPYRHQHGIALAELLSG